MIPNPIRKVLSTMEAHQVRVLLMGGQACVFYGAAEFIEVAGRHPEAGRQMSARRPLIQHAIDGDVGPQTFVLVGRERGSLRTGW